MSKDEEELKARKLAERAKDRERMARIVKRHEKPIPRETTTRQEDVSPPVARIVREAIAITRFQRKKPR